MIVAAGLKAWLIASGAIPFNADEAVVALMARHILQGEFSIFFWGQAYMGSLDAFLVAGGFLIFGQQVWVIRLVQVVLYLAILWTTALLGKKVFGSWRQGCLAASLLSIPTVNVTLYTTASLGGYGEALLLGNLILLGAIRLSEQRNQQKEPGSSHADPLGWLALLVWGFLVGLGVWAFGLSLVFSIPAGIFLFIQMLQHPWKGRLRATGWIFAGLGIGLLPIWIFAIDNGLSQLVWELRGGAIAGVENLPWVFKILQHFMHFLLLGITVIFGLRPPWSAQWLVLPLLPFVFIFWVAVLILQIRRLRKPDHRMPYFWLLSGVMLTLLAVFLFTPFGADPSGRYFVPLAIPLALFAADLINDLHERSGKWAAGLLVLILAYNLLGTVQMARQNPPGITTQFDAVAQVDHHQMPELIRFLEDEGETEGYTNYWVAYPLAFLSQENLIFVPHLPYHEDFRYTQRDDRYPPYREKVDGATRAAYITTHHPTLDTRLRQGFEELGVTWEEAVIEDYQIFYHLSRKVTPQELGLGSNR